MGVGRFTSVRNLARCAECAVCFVLCCPVLCPAVLGCACLWHVALNACLWCNLRLRFDQGTVLNGPAIQLVCAEQWPQQHTTAGVQVLPLPCAAAQQRLIMCMRVELFATRSCMQVWDPYSLPSYCCWTAGHLITSNYVGSAVAISCCLIPAVVFCICCGGNIKCG